MISKTRCTTTIVLATLFIISGCGDVPVIPGHQNSAIRGTVTDGDGTPLAETAILLTYDIPTPFAISGTDKPATNLNYEIPEAGPVHIWISEPCHGDTIKLLVDGVLSAGVHNIIWSADNEQQQTVTEGLYLFNIAYGEVVITREIFLVMATYAGFTGPVGYEVFATTDAAGKFSLSQACLDFGTEIQLYGETGEPEGLYTVPHRATVWALRTGYQTASGPKNMAISTISGATVELIVEALPPPATP